MLVLEKVAFIELAVRNSDEIFNSTYENTWLKCINGNEN